MKKWLLMFSVIALSNLLCAMEDIGADNDWDHVNDRPDELVEDLAAIAKQANEWHQVDGRDADDSRITVQGDTINFNFLHNYRDIPPSRPIPIPISHQAPHSITTSPAPSSTSYSSGLSSSSNSAASSTRQTDAPVTVAASLLSAHQKAFRQSSLPPISQPNATTFQEHSPIVRHHAVGASLLDMVSSTISHSSIETSADEDGGISRCVMHESDCQESPRDSNNGKNKVKKQKPEEMTLTEFARELLNPKELLDPLVAWVQEQIEKL